jgi:hypothetical protein
MVMRRGLVVRALELGVMVIVLGPIVCVRPRAGLQLRVLVLGAVRVRVGVPVAVTVAVLVFVRVCMHQVAMTVWM